MIALSALNNFSFLRKYPLWFVFFTMISRFSLHVNLLLIVSPRHLYESVISTSPLVENGSEGVFFYLKSKIISFVLLTFTDRILALHHVMNLFTYWNTHLHLRLLIKQLLMSQLQNIWCYRYFQDGNIKDRWQNASLWSASIGFHPLWMYIIYLHILRSLNQKLNKPRHNVTIYTKVHKFPSH